MSIKTNLTIKLDKEVRDEFGALCDEIGISMASALNAFIRQSIRRKSMSFSVRDENGFTPEESAELLRRIAGANTGKLETHNLIEVN